MTKWEYLFLTWEETRKPGLPNAAPGQLSFTFGATWEQAICIWRSGAKAPELIGKRIIVWHAGHEPLDHDIIQDFDTSWVDLCNTLGAEGWELVSTTVMSSAVITPAHGFDTGGHPVDIRYVFKRPLSDTATAVSLIQVTGAGSYRPVPTSRAGEQRAAR